MFHGGASSELTGDAGRLDARLGLALRELRALDPDIVALQEASVGRRRGDVAARLAAGLGLQRVHAPATSRIFSTGPLNRLVVWALGFAEGPAILSRFPIAGSEVYDLPRCERRLDPRVLLRAAVTTPWGMLDVYATHTSRDVCQHRRVAEVVSAQRGALPGILLGDFNAMEGGDAIGALTNGAGLVDAFRVANPEASGATVWQQIAVPYPTVARRVDFVFVRPGTRMQLRVRASRVVLDTPGRLADGGLLWASDHYGVMADLELVERR
jgi:endonuclease/exonuclease/phosphatase family metal-dependent hydrolase